MALEPGSPNARLMFRALGVTQRLVKKLGNGGTLQRDELRAGELATQALRICIADPSIAHRQELLIVEAERLAPRPPDAPREPRRDPRRDNHDSRDSRSNRGPSRGASGNQYKPQPKPTSNKNPATVTVKKKPKQIVKP